MREEGKDGSLGRFVPTEGLRGRSVQPQEAPGEFSGRHAAGPAVVVELLQLHVSAPRRYDPIRTSATAVFPKQLPLPHSSSSAVCSLLLVPVYKGERRRKTFSSFRAVEANGTTANFFFESQI